MAATEEPPGVDVPSSRRRVRPDERNASFCRMMRSVSTRNTRQRQLVRMMKNGPHKHDIVMLTPWVEVAPQRTGIQDRILRDERDV